MVRVMVTSWDAKKHFGHFAKGSRQVFIHETALKNVVPGENLFGQTIEIPEDGIDWVSQRGPRLNVERQAIVVRSLPEEIKISLLYTLIDVLKWSHSQLGRLIEWCKRKLKNL